MIVRAVLAVVVATGALAVAQPGMKWSTTLKSEGGSKVTGTATVDPGSKPNTATATISITGGEPNHTYPWHVHTGKCGAPGGPIGGGGNYKPVQTGADGSGKSTADLNVAAPASGNFSVNVHASPSEMGKIVACGDLGMAGM